MCLDCLVVCLPPHEFVVGYVGLVADWICGVCSFVCLCDVCGGLGSVLTDYWCLV